jgi:transposase
LLFLKRFSELRSRFADEAILFHDELRAGTRTELGCKWAPMGHRPVAPVRIGYENTYLYLTLCPFTGQGYAAFLPQLNSEQFGWFIQQVQACVGQQSLFVADGATAHRADLFDPGKLVFERLPAACPELNPVERFFKEVRKQLKNQVFDYLQDAQSKIKSIVEDLFGQEGKVRSLTCFPYLINTTPVV